MSYRLGLTLIMVAAIVAIGCGLYAYFVPLTGVTGVWGPLAAAFGALCLLIGGALMVKAGSRGARVVLMILLALGITSMTLTAAACNTVRGAGSDLQSAANTVDDAT